MKIRVVGVLLGSLAVLGCGGDKEAGSSATTSATASAPKSAAPSATVSASPAPSQTVSAATSAGPDMPASCKEYDDLWKKCGDKLPAADKEKAAKSHESFTHVRDADPTSKRLASICEGLALGLKQRKECK